MGENTGCDLCVSYTAANASFRKSMNYWHYAEVSCSHWNPLKVSRVERGIMHLKRGGIVVAFCLLGFLEGCFVVKCFGVGFFLRVYFLWCFGVRKGKSEVLAHSSSTSPQ